MSEKRLDSLDFHIDLAFVMATCARQADLVLGASFTSTDAPNCVLEVTACRVLPTRSQTWPQTGG
jgi:hypothetical protein